MVTNECSDTNFNHHYLGLGKTKYREFYIDIEQSYY